MKTKLTQTHWVILSLVGTVAVACITFLALQLLTNDQLIPYPLSPMSATKQENRIYLPVIAENRGGQSSLLSTYPDPTSSTFSPASTITNQGVSLPEEDETLVSNLSLAKKIGQMLLVGIEGYSISEATCQMIREIQPGGIFLQPDNVEDPKQLRELTTQLQSCAQASGNSPLFIALDHEGEYINRFNSGVSRFPAALAQAASGNLENIYKIALASGEELRYSGVNMILGPVADILMDAENTVVSQRTYGEDASMVSTYVAQAVRGYREAGLITVLKHFPGHGGIEDDSHEGLPVDNVSKDILLSLYLMPFRQGLAEGAPVVMLSHVAFPEISGDLQPTSHSPQVIQLLQNELGFKGFILSDAMNMKAVTGERVGVPQASLLSVQAGVEMLLITKFGQVRATYERLLSAAEQGTIPAEQINSAVEHILEVKLDYGLLDSNLVEVPEPDWQAHMQLAREVGYQAITLIKNVSLLVPLPGDRARLLVVGPDREWQFYQDLGAALVENGFEPKFIYYSPPWDGPIPDSDLLSSLPKMLSQYDLTLVFTWQAYLNQFLLNDDWQIRLVNNLLETRQPIIVVALKSPTDLLGFPNVPVYLATYGTTDGAMEGIVDILLGRRAAVGINPLPDLLQDKSDDRDELGSRK